MNSKKAALLFSVGIFVIVVSISAGNAMQGSLLSELIDFYRLKSAGQGSIGSFQSIGSILGIFLPFILTRYVKKPNLLLAMLLLEAGSMLLIGLHPVYLIFVLLYIVFGVMKGISDSVMASSLSDLHSGATLAKYLGVQQGAFGIGGLVMPLLIGHLLQGGTAWYSIYLLTAGIVAVFCVVYFALFRASAPHLPQFSAPAPFEWRTLFSIFSDNRDRLLLIGMFTCSISQIGYYLWVGRFVQIQLGNPLLGQTALAMFWVGTAVSRIVVPQLKLPPMAAIFWGNLLAAAAIVAGVLSMSPMAVVVCSFLSALFNGYVFTFQVYISCSWHKKLSLMASTFSFLVFYIGQIISPPLVGLVNDTLGLTVGMMIAPLFAVVGAVLALPLLREKI